MSDIEFAESKFNEDDEQMVVVRGATSSVASGIQERQEQKKMPVIQELPLCDYYLIIGHRKRFKVYPFVKKRGKATDNVGNCVFEYDEAIRKIELTEDTNHNLQELEGNLKLQSIIAFAAMLAKIKIDEVVNISSLQEISNSEMKSSESIFEVFDMISKIYQNNKQIV